MHVMTSLAAPKASTTLFAATTSGLALLAAALDQVGGAIGTWGPATAVVVAAVTSARWVMNGQSRAAAAVTAAQEQAAEVIADSHARVVADLEAAIERRDRQLAELADEIGRLRDGT